MAMRKKQQAQQPQIHQMPQMPQQAQLPMNVPQPPMNPMAMQQQMMQMMSAEHMAVMQQFMSMSQMAMPYFNQPLDVLQQFEQHMGEYDSEFGFTETIEFEIEDD